MPFHRSSFRRRCLLLLTAVLSYNELRADTLSLPLTAKQIESYIDSHDVHTVEDFIDALPRSYTDSFTLIHDSRSLQRATPLQPRQILFGPDARFIIAISGVPEDPNYHSVEFAEFDPQEGLYHFGVIDFTPAHQSTLLQQTPTVQENVAHCKGCHGQNSRPIWQIYPDWPGAYGDQEGHIATKEQKDFLSFAATAAQSSRYKHLRFSTDANGSTFYLTGRRYPFANTNLNHEIGNTVAIGTVTRMQRHQNYNVARWAVLAASPAMGCIDSDSWPDTVRKINRSYKSIESSYAATSNASIKAHRILGVDPVRELSIESFAFNPSPGSAGYWQTGAFRLDEAVSFLVLRDLMQASPSLKQIFEPQAWRSDQIAYYMSLTGEARATALLQSYNWFQYFDVFDPVVRQRQKLNQVCEILSKNIQ